MTLKISYVHVCIAYVTGMLQGISYLWPLRCTRNPPNQRSQRIIVLQNEVCHLLLVSSTTNFNKNLHFWCSQGGKLVETIVNFQSIESLRFSLRCNVDLPNYLTAHVCKKKSIPQRKFINKLESIGIQRYDDIRVRAFHTIIIPSAKTLLVIFNFS